MLTELSVNPVIFKIISQICDARYVRVRITLHRIQNTETIMKYLTDNAQGYGRKAIYLSHVTRISKLNQHRLKSPTKPRAV
jgi:hypothetical protein